MVQRLEIELAQLKRDVDLLSLVRESGVGLRRHGRDWIGLCPLHDDREPSLVVTPAKGLWQCLGACRTGGSPLDWLMKSQGLDFSEALEVLRRRVGNGTPRPRATGSTPGETFTISEADSELLERV